MNGFTIVEPNNYRYLDSIHRLLSAKSDMMTTYMKREDMPIRHRSVLTFLELFGTIRAGVKTCYRARFRMVNNKRDTCTWGCQDRYHLDRCTTHSLNVTS